MTDHLNLIRIKLQHLSRRSEYLAYSVSQVGSVLKLKDWAALSPDQHESLAAFRVRFSELQTLQPVLVGAGSRLLTLCAQTLSVLPTTADFEAEFQRVCATIRA